MEEISSLQARLHEIQSVDLISRITERVSVDLILKLQHDMNFPLIITIDGSAYITPEYLESKILEELIFHKKISKNYIIEMFNVHKEKLDLTLSSLMKKNDNIQIIDDWLCHDEYFIDVIQQINEELIQSESMEISDISMKYSLPITFLRDLLNNNIQNNKISGCIINNHLISLNFNELLLTKLTGLLQGTYLPLSLLSIKDLIASPFPIEIDEIFIKITQLLSINVLDGKIVDNIYYQTKFLSTRDLIVLHAFNDNQYIQYKILNDLYIIQIEKVLYEVIRSYKCKKNKKKEVNVKKLLQYDIIEKEILLKYQICLMRNMLKMP